MQNISDFLSCQKEKGQSDKAIESCWTDLMQFERWFTQTYGEEAELKDLTLITIRSYKHFLLTILKQTPATVKRRLAVLKALSKWALENRLIEESPLKIKNAREDTYSQFYAPLGNIGLETLIPPGVPSFF